MRASMPRAKSLILPLYFTFDRLYIYVQYKYTTDIIAPNFYIDLPSGQSNMPDRDDSACVSRLRVCLARACPAFK